MNALGSFRSGSFVGFKRLIHMYPSGACEPIVIIHKEPIFVDEH